MLCFLFLFLFSSVAPSPHTHHTISHCCHGVCTGSAAWLCTHPLRCGVSHRKGEKEGKCCGGGGDGGDVEVGEMSDQCGTACALHQHAAHGMPAHCEFADGHLTACSAPLCMPALHGCSASFLLALPLLHMVVVKKEEGEGEGEGAAMCLQKDQHTNVCTHSHWMQSGGCSRLRHTRTPTPTHAAGGHPSFHTTA